jgi:selenophosphate synthetase-related protein
MRLDAGDLLILAEDLDEGHPTPNMPSHGSG